MSIGRVTNWTVYRVTLVSANVQYSQQLSTGVKSVYVHSASRSGSFRISLIDAHVEGGTKFLTVHPGGDWRNNKEILDQKTIYLSSDTANTVIEIEEWS